MCGVISCHVCTVCLPSESEDALAPVATCDSEKELFELILEERSDSVVVERDSESGLLAVTLPDLIATSTE